MARAREAARELLASPEDVWGFLAEPYHLTDWWPGLRGVEPDRRGFTVDARWKVFCVDRSFYFGLPTRASSGPVRPGTLEITAIDPGERWAWRIVLQHRVRPTTVDSEVRLARAAPDRTIATVVCNGRKGDARLAVDRLYELVQTAATLG